MNIEKNTEQNPYGIKNGDMVRVVNSSNGSKQTIHQGKVVQTTQCGARVYRPKRNSSDIGGDADISTVEWFPFVSKVISMVKTN